MGIQNYKKDDKWQYFVQSSLMRIIWPMTRISLYNETDNEKDIIVNNIDKIEKIREEAEIKEIIYKIKLEKSYKKG